jgi:hypothetical protein
LILNSGATRSCVHVAVTVTLIASPRTGLFVLISHLGVQEWGAVPGVGVHVMVLLAARATRARLRADLMNLHNTTWSVG